MKKIQFISILFIFQWMVMPSFAQTWQDSPDIEKIFTDAQVTGTFVSYDVSSKKLTGFNQQRASTPFRPASTFKITNSLIALATGTVKNVDEILPYGGGSYAIKTWEHDMSLRQAISISNLPLYQGVARRIGLEKMQTYLELFHYGNMQSGDKVDRFWLDGPLKISAIEQTLFLANLAQGTLPIDSEIQDHVREILLLESGENWKLYGKTGWFDKDEDHGTGWWVGWIEKDQRIYAFALNLDGKFGQESLQQRLELGKASLCTLGLYPCPSK